MGMNVHKEKKENVNKNKDISNTKKYQGIYIVFGVLGTIIMISLLSFDIKISLNSLLILFTGSLIMTLSGIVSSIMLIFNK